MKRARLCLLVSAALLASLMGSQAVAAIGDTQTFSDGGIPVIGDAPDCPACLANGWLFGFGFSAGVALDAGEGGAGDHALLYDSGGFGFHLLTWEGYTTADTNFLGNFLEAGVVAVRFRARHSGSGDSVVLRAFLFDVFEDNTLDSVDWAISDGAATIANTATTWQTYTISLRVSDLESGAYSGTPPTVEEILSGVAQFGLRHDPNFDGPLRPDRVYAAVYFDDIELILATTYAVDRAVGPGTITGTIETNGTTGVLSAADIIDWNLTVDADGIQSTFGQLLGPLSGNNSSINFLEGSALTATPTALFFDFSLPDFAIFQIATPSFDVVWQLQAEAPIFSDEVIAESFSNFSYVFRGPIIDQIATAVAVNIVDIDIKPGSDPNAVNPDARGFLPVAILTDGDFDALWVDYNTVAFGPSGAAPARAAKAEDVDGDGDSDLILHFKIAETGIACGDSEATLTGETLDGQAITGTDAIVTVPPGGSPQATCLPIINGTFETGDFTGWTPSGINGGFAVVEEEGTCFSFFDTRGLTFNGNFAANVRSSGPAPTSSVGILTSDPFEAGSGISFRALSENADVNPVPDPVTLEVSVLDAADVVLHSQVFPTNIVTLDGPCPGGTLRDGTFSTHLVDTSAYSGTAIRVQFRQHTNHLGWGFFTLIDDVEVIP